MNFSEDIKPLFRDEDREEMLYAFDLWDYADVKQYSASILYRVDDGTMPCDEPWPQERIDLFRRWIDAGMPE